MANPDDSTHRFEVGKNDLEAFSLCLILGTLDAMRSGAWPTEAGIWTLGRPIFREPLAAAGIAKEVMEELEAADELHAIEGLCGRPAAEEALDRMIAVVRSRLAALPDRNWYAFWSGGPGG
jgi:hypothetical protein